jgi:hypothetical protein
MHCNCTGRARPTEHACLDLKLAHSGAPGSGCDTRLADQYTMYFECTQQAYLGRTKHSLCQWPMGVNFSIQPVRSGTDGLEVAITSTSSTHTHAETGVGSQAAITFLDHCQQWWCATSTTCHAYHTRIVDIATAWGIEPHVHLIEKRTAPCAAV